MEKTSNGIIKYYSIYSKKLQFEGIYLRGKRIKYGREYCYDGFLKYEGYYLYGEKTGKGKEYLNKRLIYSGEFRYNKRNGKGKEYDYNEKIIFEGEYLNGNRWNGIGYDGQGNKIYELKGGYGIIKEYNICNILIYEGEYSNGKRNGKGKEYNCNGFLNFEGEYLDGKRWNGKKFVYEENSENIKNIIKYLNGICDEYIYY